MPILTLQTRKIPGYAGILLKIGWTPLGPLTLFTFRYIFELAALKNSPHSDFPTAGTKEFLGNVGCTGVFTCLTHGYTPCQKAFIGDFRKTSKIPMFRLLWPGQTVNRRFDGGSGFTSIERGEQETPVYRICEKWKDTGAHSTGFSLFWWFFPVH